MKPAARPVIISILCTAISGSPKLDIRTAMTAEVCTPFRGALLKFWYAIEFPWFRRTALEVVLALWALKSPQSAGHRVQFLSEGSIPGHEQCCGLNTVKSRFARASAPRRRALFPSNSFRLKAIHNPHTLTPCPWSPVQPKDTTTFPLTRICLTITLPGPI